uniref:OTU domain-containing protein n=1 Tax=Globisporangium ultimum (strain ATCC 200006 / CBS 805.95 / DAOM BR144) TaxID=431595 RepID=K3WEB1_GLOUD
MASKNETPGQMKQRHKLELRNLQTEVKAFQKKAKKDKLSKKDTETQIQQMENDLKHKHEQELAALQTSDGEDEAAEGAKAEAPTETPPVPAKPQGPTKAQRRREKLRKQEQERNERIEEENNNTVSERQIEADIILSKLKPHNLVIKDIPSDGHCMYHAVADQMKQHRIPYSGSEPMFKYLRRITGEYMRARPDDYLPFLALDESSGKSSQELLEEYCDRVINTSDWGGQLELRALACALQAPIQVFSAESDVISMGDEFADQSTPLQLTYHLHYYTLGEHFNSVTPAQ